jgi:hypothetical protein
MAINKDVEVCSHCGVSIDDFEKVWYVSPDASPGSVFKMFCPDCYIKWKTEREIEQSAVQQLSRFAAQVDVILGGSGNASPEQVLERLRVLIDSVENARIKADL